jgi:hypothetical protein
MSVYGAIQVDHPRLKDNFRVGRRSMNEANVHSNCIIVRDSHIIADEARLDVSMLVDEKG